MSVEVVVTRGGALAIRDRATGEVMHPVIGPRVEAEQLYVAPSRLAARLEVAGEGPLVLFDVGLGAGSNAVAAWRLSEARPVAGRRLEIVSFDNSLAALALALDHGAAFDLDGAAGDAARALLAGARHESDRTVWRLVAGELPGALASEPAGSADVVFWDPFSPRASPALWSVAAFAALRRCCAPRATVHTYSAATSTRAAMLLAGFAVGTGLPSGSKEQTTAGAVDPVDLARPLDARWLDRLGRSSAPFPADAPPDALARIGRLAQFAGLAPACR
jgi:queuine tRNA-ribosyltransferase